jgi:hypothetical protein
MKIEPPNAQNLFSSLITHTITKLRSRTSGSHMGCGRRAPSRHDPAFGLVGGMDRSIRSGFLFSLATESGERPAEKSQPSPPPATRTYARDTARVYIRMSNRFCSVPRCDVTTHTFCWGSLRFPSKALWTSWVRRCGVLLGLWSVSLDVCEYLYLQWRRVCDTQNLIHICSLQNLLRCATGVVHCLPWPWLPPSLYLTGLLKILTLIYIIINCTSNILMIHQIIIKYMIIFTFLTK